MKTKMKMYETLVMAVFTYGAQCWTIKAEGERRILAADMSWLRRIAGISRREKCRNVDIRIQLRQTVSLVDKIQQQRLRWFGHVERMSSERLLLKALHTIVEGKRSKGRQRKRWTDNIKEDLTKEGISMEEANTRLQNRQDWRAHIHSAPSSDTQIQTGE